jgi:hypothetical protein
MALIGIAAGDPARMGESALLVVRLSASWACASETIETMHARQVINRRSFFIIIKGWFLGL